jgi:hypothetical protein
MYGIVVVYPLVPCMVGKNVTYPCVCREAYDRLSTVHGSLGKQGKSVVTMTTSVTLRLVLVTNRVKQERHALAVTYYTGGNSTLTECGN